MLERVTSGRRCVVTRAVLDEIERGRELYPALADVPTLPWIEIVPVDSLGALVAFNHYVRVLGFDDRNIGEASILAWAEISSNIAVVDDSAAVNAAKLRKVRVLRSLGLLCNALQRGVATVDEVRRVIDDLKTIGGARLPCDGAGFERWAEDHGLLTAR